MATGSSAPIVPAAIRSYQLEGDVILFDERSARLFALNSTASVIWFLFVAGSRPEEIAAELHKHTEVPLERAADDINQLVAQWQRAGLIEAEGIVRPPCPAGPVPPDVAEQPAGAYRNATPTQRLTFSRILRLMDGSIRVSGDAEVAAMIDSLFGHIAGSTNETDDDSPTIEIFKDERHWVVLVDGILAGTCTDTVELAPFVYGTVSSMIYHLSDCFAALHAAAVSKGGRCVLMPGRSGSGKSTLTAALIGRGYAYCADDLAILTASPIRLRPVPLHVGVKSDSWPALARLLPELEKEPAHKRVVDGKLVKYLQPAGRRSHEKELTVAAVVFPQFSRGATARLVPIARSSALLRMTDAGYDLSETLDDASVQSLVSWLQSIPCYELPFDDLEEAAEVFSSVLA